MTTDTTELYYDPYDYDVDVSAQHVWKRLRDEAPVYWNEKFEFYALSRYDDVLTAMLDTDTFSSAHATTIELMTHELEWVHTSTVRGFAKVPLRLR